MNRKTREKRSSPKCECGCEGVTKGGRFLPGHDAKLKKSLIEAALEGKKRAENRLNQLGWTKFLDAKRSRAKAGPGEDVSPESPKPAEVESSQE